MTPDITTEKVACTDCGKIELYYLLFKGLCHGCRMARDIVRAEQFYGEDR